LELHLRSGPPQLFALRRAACVQAWYLAHAGTKANCRSDPILRLYAASRSTISITMNVLDAPNSRTPPACGRGRKAITVAERARRAGHDA